MSDYGWDFFCIWVIQFTMKIEDSDSLLQQALALFAVLCWDSEIQNRKENEIARQQWNGVNGQFKVIKCNKSKNQTSIKYASIIESTIGRYIMPA